MAGVVPVDGVGDVGGQSVDAVAPSRTGAEAGTEPVEGVQDGGEAGIEADRLWGGQVPTTVRVSVSVSVAVVTRCACCR
jgi:hypothetical protein